MSSLKYSKAVLEDAVLKSSTIVEVLKRIGAPQTYGGLASYIRGRIRFYGIDTSHFLGCAWARGKTLGRAACNKRAASYHLVKGSRRATRTIRRCMTEVGIPLLCNLCGQNSSWVGRPLVLQIDHIDGDSYNNEISNLRFLCPNCHSQTETFGSKNKKSGH